jgi:hypothetical protein
MCDFGDKIFSAGPMTIVGESLITQRRWNLNIHLYDADYATLYIFDSRARMLRNHWSLECGVSVGQLIKQWEMTSLLCAHCLPVNRAFQNRSNICDCESLWLLECKQWEMTSLLCAHYLHANRSFQNQKSGWSTRSFLGEMAKFARCPVCKNNRKLL